MSQVNGFSGGTPPESELTDIGVETATPPGTDPVVPDGSSVIDMVGAQVGAGTTTNVIRTASLAANQVTIQVQRSSAQATSTVGANGVSHFSSDDFDVDSDGFVTLAAGSGGITSINIQTFNYTGSSQTYTPTPGMLYCIVEMVGGGGSGGGNASPSVAQVRGGGGGACGGRSTFSAADIGSSQTVTVGVGGSAGSNGGTTSLGSLMTCGGGGAGASAPSGSQNGGSGSSTSTGCDATFPGQNGTFPVPTVADWPGNGGSSMYGNGASAEVPSGTAPTQSTVPGTGGAGSWNTQDQNGGQGGHGKVVITEYIS